MWSRRALQAMGTSSAVCFEQGQTVRKPAERAGGLWCRSWLRRTTTMTMTTTAPPRTVPMRATAMTTSALGQTAAMRAMRTTTTTGMTMA